MKKNRELGKRDELFVKALRGRAVIHRHLGNFDDGISDYKNIISLCEKKGYSTLSLVPDAMVGMSSIFTEGKTDYKNAEKMIKHALAKIKGKKESKIYARCYNILGSIYSHRGDYNEGLKYYQKSFDVTIYLGVSTRTGGITTRD
jgi:tetratricopeptide (TPR) repeat protein